jgi:iron complex transport system substrate-binding protein
MEHRGGRFILVLTSIFRGDNVPPFTLTQILLYLRAALPAILPELRKPIWPGLSKKFFVEKFLQRRFLPKKILTGGALVGGIFLSSGLLAGTLAAPTKGLPPSGPSPAKLGGEGVISLFLCGDIFLSALAEKTQIKGLSPLARDPLFSPIANFAADLPIINDTESALLSGAEIALTSRYTSRRYRLDLLRRAGMRLVVVEESEDFSSLQKTTQTIGELLGPQAQKRAQAWLANFDLHRQQLQGLPSFSQEVKAPIPASLPPAPRVLWLESGGFAAGPQSFKGHLLAALGWHNLAPFPFYGYISLELLSQTAPDYVIIPNRRQGSLAEQWLSHPLFHHAHIQRLPAPHMGCATPDAGAVMIALKNAALKAALKAAHKADILSSRPFSAFSAQNIKTGQERPLSSTPPKLHGFAADMPTHLAKFFPDKEK